MFTGREYFAWQGMYDYRNRIYLAGLGRFMQTDPIRFKANDVNLYRYVFNNPVDAMDPMGLINDPAQETFYPYQVCNFEQKLRGKDAKNCPCPPKVTGSATVEGDISNRDAAKDAALQQLLNAITPGCQTDGDYTGECHTEWKKPIG